ncbi:MAG: T9SS type A sorting domain-containing protein [Saprospiraceae bacterium]
MKLIFATLFGIFLSFPIHAQWESMQGPYGGWIFDLKQNDNYQFACSEGGIFRSSDGGLSWKLLSPGEQSGYEAEHIGVFKTTLVAGCRSGISPNEKKYLFLSHDNGDHWQPVTYPDSAYFYEIVVSEFGIYLEGFYHLWFSTDDGITWSYSKLDSLVQYYDALTIYDGVIYIGGHNAIYKSSSEDDWTKIEVDGLHESINSIDVFDSIFLVREYQYGKLYRSGDYGNTWTHSEIPDWGNGWTHFVKINNDIYANYHHQVLRSVDAGKTWEEIAEDNGGWFYKMINVDSVIIGGSLGEGIFRSVDLGNSFKQSNKGLGATVVNAVTVDSDYVWTGCNYIGISRQDKSNGIWSDVLLPTQYELFDIKPLDDHLFVIADFSLIYRTQDDGVTWTDVTPVFIDQQSSELFTFGHSILAGGISAVFGNSPLIISSDLGNTWKPFALKINNNNYWPSLIAEKGNYLFTTDWSNVFRSQDNGMTWEIKVNNLNLDTNWNSSIVNIIVSDNFILLLEANMYKSMSRIHISRDHGDSWDVLASSAPHDEFNGFNYVTAVDDILIASGQKYNSGMYVSFDEGDSWRPFNEGLFAGGIIKLTSDETYLYAATSGQGVWRRKISDLYTTSTVSPTLRNDIIIFPNPTTGNFTLKIESQFAGKGQLSISDLNGKIIISKNIALEPEIKIQAESLSAGVYILSLRTDQKSYTAKFVVQAFVAH